jgi:hypothetical protein
VQCVAYGSFKLLNHGGSKWFIIYCQVWHFFYWKFSFSWLQVSSGVNILRIQTKLFPVSKRDSRQFWRTFFIIVFRTFVIIIVFRTGNPEKVSRDFSKISINLCRTNGKLFPNHQNEGNFSPLKKRTILRNIHPWASFLNIMIMQYNPISNNCLIIIINPLHKCNGLRVKDNSSVTEDLMQNFRTLRQTILEEKWSSLPKYIIVGSNFFYMNLFKVPLLFFG